MPVMYAVCVYGFGRLISFLDVVRPAWWVSLMESDNDSVIRFATCKWCLSFWVTTIVWLPVAHVIGSVTYVFMVALIFFITASNTGLLDNDK